MPSLKDVLRALLNDPALKSSASNPTIIDFIETMPDVPTLDGASEGSVLSVTADPPGENARIFLVPSAGDATGGTFTITFDGQTTTALAFNATNLDIDAALELLSSIGAGNTAVNNDFNAGIDIFFTNDLGEQVILASRLSLNGASLTGPSSPYTAVSTQDTLGNPAGPLLTFWD